MTARSQDRTRRLTGAVHDEGGVTARADGAAVWRLDLAYEGTDFHGWARQPGQRTVEGVLLEALSRVLREPVSLSVAGRTDAGVHARAQVASFVCRGRGLHPEDLRHSLNALLPPDLVVTLAQPATHGFVAREARSRTYRYRLWLSPVKPLRERAFVWALGGAIDTALLREAAALLPGRQDFAALTPSARLYRSCVREVLAATWRSGSEVEGDVEKHRAALRQTDHAPVPVGDEWVFEVRADSFLHNMVRVAVGSMVDVARSRMTLEHYALGLAGGERRRMGQTAPARGLTLAAVEY